MKYVNFFFIPLICFTLSFAVLAEVKRDRIIKDTNLRLAVAYSNFYRQMVEKKIGEYNKNRQNVPHIYKGMNENTKKELQSLVQKYHIKALPQINFDETVGIYTATFETYKLMFTHVDLMNQRVWVNEKLLDLNKFKSPNELFNHIHKRAKTASLPFIEDAYAIEPMTIALLVMIVVGFCGAVAWIKSFFNDSTVEQQEMALNMRKTLAEWQETCKESTGPQVDLQLNREFMALERELLGNSYEDLASTTQEDCKKGVMKTLRYQSDEMRNTVNKNRLQLQDQINANTGNSGGYVIPEDDDIMGNITEGCRQFKNLVDCTENKSVSITDTEGDKIEIKGPTYDENSSSGGSIYDN